MSYVGRFAPSPTGPLHAGSVLAAVASYLHARRAGGKWLVRIDDIDPPREAPGAADAILAALERLALHWDGSVLHQSTHLELYRAVAQRLLAEDRAFLCTCSRKELHAYAASHPGSPAYPGTCRNRRRGEGPAALRMRVDDPGAPVVDALQGTLSPDAFGAGDDYVIHRRDGFPAYHLAAVVDDALQGVTTVVRGADLLESAAAQQHLQRALRLPTPAYLHVPVLVDARGNKLSKQTGAVAIDLTDPSGTAAEVLAYLGAARPPELRGAGPPELWEWAVENWRIEALAGIRAIQSTETHSGVPDHRPAGRAACPR